MEPYTRDNPNAETPEALLDLFRDHPEWTDRQRGEQFDRLIESSPRERLIAAARARFRDLRGEDSGPVLRLVEAYASPALLRELAEALVAQPDLAVDRAWEALRLIDGAGLLAGYPELAERWDELNEAIDEEGSLDELAEQLETDPEGTWLALQGLGAVEPEVRAAIVADLARVPIGPGLIEFLRLLSFAHDRATRDAALDVLKIFDTTAHSRIRTAWASIATDHPDPEVVAQARGRLGGQDLAVRVRQTAPRLVRSLVTALDGLGQGTVVLSSSQGPNRVTAAFLCDVCRGVRHVVGQVVPESPIADRFFREFTGKADRDWVEDVGELAVGLLAGSLLLCGPETTPALRFWLEETIGPRFQPRPLPAPFAGWDPASLALDEIACRAEHVLDACPDWRDRSDLTFEIAEEIMLREGDSPPDPRRDAGAYRYLFEHRLLGRLELYQRMLFWMASFWESAGNLPLGRSALALALQYSDAQHAVPGHPFTVAVTTRSLTAAQASLRRGADPRRRPGTS